jgi:hypothetical protein
VPSDPPLALTARQDKKLAGPVEAVVELYDKFIAGFAKDGALPTQVEEGSEHAYLQAHFHKARRRWRGVASRRRASLGRAAEAAGSRKQGTRLRQELPPSFRLPQARAQGKLHGAESLRGSLASYQVMVAYFDANKVEGMDDEAQICREMAELLPRRIDMASKAQS